jgi:tetratricopeptide (TPR) repeat protein
VALRIGVLALATVWTLACGPTMDQATADGLITQARKLDLDGQTEAAIALYTRVLDARAESYDAHYGIGRALDLAGRYQEAREHFARAIELAPEADKDQTLRMMGLAWTFARNAEEAARYFKEVFDRRVAAGNFAGAAEVANELGRVYLELGVFERAENWYQAGHATAAREVGRPGWRIDLADMRWAHARARIAARRGAHADARRQTDVVRQILDKGGNEDQRAQYESLRGYVDVYLKQPGAAVSVLKQADQADPFVLVLLGQAHEELGDADRAAEYYRLALQSTSHAVGNAIARPFARERLSLRQ